MLLLLLLLLMLLLWWLNLGIWLGAGSAPLRSAGGQRQATPAIAAVAHPDPQQVGPTQLPNLPLIEMEGEG